MLCTPTDTETLHTNALHSYMYNYVRTPVKVSWLPPRQFCFDDLAAEHKLF